MIRENRSAFVIANSIHLHRQQDPRTVLIIEGSTDKRAFEQFIDIKKCRCIISSSREKAVQILEELEKNDFQGVIAIIDKDSDNLSEFLWNKSNLIFTDSHDLETMIINSDALKLFVTTHF